MPKLTIGRMAKLYGLHRSTLYEAVDRGRVTAGMNTKGQREIDLSEMIRAYGEPPGRPDTNPTDPTPTGTGAPTPIPDTLQPLLEELRALREEVRELRETMRRLPAPSAQSTHESTPPSVAREPVASVQSKGKGKGTLTSEDVLRRFQERSR